MINSEQWTAKQLNQSFYDDLLSIWFVLCAHGLWALSESGLSYEFKIVIDAKLYTIFDKHFSSIVDAIQKSKFN